MGESGSFEDIYEQHYSRVFKFIQRKIIHIQEAEDLTQEVFLAAFRNFERFDPAKASVTTWLYVIMNNRLKNYYRDRRELMTLDDEEHPVDLAAPELLEEAVLLEERRSILLEALTSLPEREREVVRMRYLEERSSAETAVALGTSAGNVRVLLNRALKKIRNYFLIHYGKDGEML